MLADIVQTGLASWWAPFLAFAAGVVSFASPCVFPLVPGYVSFVSGEAAVAGDVAVTTERRRRVSSILLFIAGFGAVFTSLGAFSAALGPILKQPIGLRLSGAVVALFGAAMILYALRIGWPGLYAERRPFLGRVKPGRAWAFPLGMAFAVGWTPCIGPVLGGILTLAAAQGGSARGLLLMAAYSVGLGLPFMLVGAGLTRLMDALTFVKRNYRGIALVSGGIMLVIGVLMVTGLWLSLLNPLLQWIGRFTPAL